MFSVISRSVRPTASISSYLAKRSFTEKSYDGERESELRRGMDRLIEHACISDSISCHNPSHESTKLFFNEENSSMVWEAQNISLKKVVKFMLSEGAEITPYILHKFSEE